MEQSKKPDQFNKQSSDELTEWFYSRFPSAPKVGDIVKYVGRKKFCFRRTKLDYESYYTVKKIIYGNVLLGISPEIELEKIPKRFALSEFRVVMKKEKMPLDKIVFEANEKNPNLQETEEKKSPRVGNYVKIKSGKNLFRQFGRILQIMGNEAKVGYGSYETPIEKLIVGNEMVPLEDIEKVDGNSRLSSSPPDC